MPRPALHDRPISWVSDTLIDFNGVRVELCVPPDLYDRQSTENHFILGKSKSMIDAMMQRTETLDVRTIVDVGVYKGGSVVFLNGRSVRTRLLRSIATLRTYRRCAAIATIRSVRIGFASSWEWTRPIIRRSAESAIRNSAIIPST